MSSMNIQQRKFAVKAGMTVDDVKNSKDATALQKKYASAFDTDGQKGFSQKEADLFNATTFSEKADGSVTFWTRQKDGTKKGTKFDSKDKNIQFKSEDEVKPYIKQVKVKKAVKKKNESVSFFDEKWSGHQIARLTGDNAVTDWLQDKDKVCTDGKDDGKIGFWESAKSLAKGLIGGIPKAIINHPITTAVTIGAGAAAVILTSGAILPVLGAAGVVMGVGMAGYGGYKAATAKTDGEAKQALETLGMGITTTALSMQSAGKALEKAAEAGVKSAQVSEDAGIIEKTVQMFKAIPESLTKSEEWTRFNLDIPVAKICNDEGFVLEKSYGNDSYRQYKGKYTFARNDASDYNLSYEKLPNGTTKLYDHTYSEPHLLEENFANGAYKKYDRYNNGRLLEERTADGTVRRYSEYSSNELLEETYADGGYKKFDSQGNITEELRVKDGKTSHYKNGNLIEEKYSNGGYIKYDSKGNIVQELRVNGDTQSYYENGKLLKETFADGTYKKYSSNVPGRVSEETLPDGTKINRWIKYKGIEKRFTQTTLKDGTYKVIDEATGKLFEEKLADGTIKAYYSKYKGMEGNLTVVTKDGVETVIDSNTGKVLEGMLVEGNKTSFYKSGKLISAMEEFPNGGCKFYDDKGILVEERIVDGNKTSTYQHGKLIKESFNNGAYKKYDGNGKVIEQKTAEDIVREFKLRRQEREARMALSEGYYEEAKRKYYRVEGTPGNWRAYDRNGNNIEAHGCDLEEYRRPLGYIEPKQDKSISSTSESSFWDKLFNPTGGHMKPLYKSHRMYHKH